MERMSPFGPSGKTMGLLRKEPKADKEKERGEANPICRDCLAFRTKFCDWSHISFNPEKDGGLAGPVLQPTDRACVRFYPLEARLKDDPRFHRLIHLPSRFEGASGRL